MKKRHVFSAPSLDVAQAVVDAARAAGIGRECIKIEARSDIETSRIRDDSKNVSMDFIPAALRGTLFGALVGLVVGIVFMFVPAIGLSGGGALALMVVGALMGTFASVLVGASVPDEVRRTFANEIESGSILVVVDGDPEQFELVERAMADAGGIRLPYEVSTALT
jgi:hypothetical protein